MECVIPARRTVPAREVDLVPYSFTADTCPIYFGIGVVSDYIHWRLGTICYQESASAKRIENKTIWSHDRADGNIVGPAPRNACTATIFLAFICTCDKIALSNRRKDISTDS